MPARSSDSEAAFNDAEGVGFEVMRIGGGSVNLRLDLRWKNDSGKTIAYGQAFELYQMKDGVWQKVTPARQVDYPDIGLLQMQPLADNMNGT